MLEECLRAVWGEAATWRLTEGAAASPAEKAAAPAAEHPALRHPTVQAALDIFGGTVETIDEGER